jgi:iron complex outermembrane receptor protein
MGVAFILSLILLAGGPAAPRPDSMPEAPARRDTLELPAVEARPAPADLSRPGSVLVPGDEDRLMGNLGDLLERTSGLHVVRSGGLGDYLGVSIRGSSERQVNVYVDGVLQNQASDPAYLLADWDLARIDRIEVYRGLAPEQLAGAPMGGAINIVTRKEMRGKALRVSAGTGSFGTFRAGAGGEYLGEKWRLHGQVARNQSRGDFPYYDDNGTEFTPGRFPDGAPRRGEDDLVRKIRRNNAHGFTEAAGDVNVQVTPSISAGGQADVSGLNKQIPSPYASQADSSVPSTFRESARTFLRGYVGWAGREGEATLDLSGNFLRDLYVDTGLGRGVVGVGRDDDRNRYTDAIATLWGRRRLGGGFACSALLSYAVSRYRYEDRHLGQTYPWIVRYIGEGKLTPSFAAGRHAAQVSLSANLELQEPYASGLHSGSGLAQDAWDGHWALRGGYRYQALAWLAFAANAGNSYRVPTFLEKFGDRGALVGSPDLKPEAAVNASLGSEMRWSAGSLDLEGFASQGRRIITLIQASQFVMHYDNSGATRIIGVEARGTARPAAWSRTELDLTFQKAMSLSDRGTEGYLLLPYRPLTQASLRQAFTWRGWSCDVTGYYQGLAYPNASNRPTLFDSYSHNTEWQSRWDLGMSWRVAHLLVGASLRNAFDQRLFDFFNYPLPGRSFAATAQAEF